jgi:hypothetical protein
VRTPVTVGAFTVRAVVESLFEVWVTAATAEPILHLWVLTGPVNVDLQDRRTSKPLEILEASSFDRYMDCSQDSARNKFLACFITVNLDFSMCLRNFTNAGIDTRVSGPQGRQAITVRRREDCFRLRCSRAAACGPAADSGRTDGVD